MRSLTLAVGLVLSLIFAANNLQAEMICKKAQLGVTESRYVPENFVPVSNVELNQSLSVNDAFIEDTCKLAGARAFNGYTAENFCEKFDNAYKYNGKYLEIVSHFYAKENDDKPKLLFQVLGEKINCKPRSEIVMQQPVVMNKPVQALQQQPAICIATAEAKNADGAWSIMSQKKVPMKAGVKDAKNYCMHTVQGMYKEPQCSAKLGYTKHFRLSYGFALNASMGPVSEVLAQKTCVVVKSRVLVKDKEAVSAELPPSNPTSNGEVLMDPIFTPPTPAGAVLEPKITIQQAVQPIQTPAAMQKLQRTQSTTN